MFFLHHVVQILRYEKLDVNLRLYGIDRVDHLSILSEFEKLLALLLLSKLASSSVRRKS